MKYNSECFKKRSLEYSLVGNQTDSLRNSLFSQITYLCIFAQPSLMGTLFNSVYQEASKSLVTPEVKNRDQLINVTLSDWSHRGTWQHWMRQLEFTYYMKWAAKSECVFVEYHIFITSQFCYCAFC